MNDGSAFESELEARSSNTCELCSAAEALTPLEVLGAPEPVTADGFILACQTCSSQVRGESDLEAKHWFCLRDSIWSEVPAVQVVGSRLLARLTAEGWAQDLLGQVYLPDDVQAWADAAPGAPEGSDEVITLDSNGAQLHDGDSVTLIKDLDVKGAGFVAKRGTMVRNIHLINDPGNIEGRVNKITLVLKTKFLKRVS